MKDNFVIINYFQSQPLLFQDRVLLPITVCFLSWQSMYLPVIVNFVQVWNVHLQYIHCLFCFSVEHIFTINVCIVSNVVSSSQYFVSWWSMYLTVTACSVNSAYIHQFMYVLIQGRAYILQFLFCSWQFISSSYIVCSVPDRSVYPPINICTVSRHSMYLPVTICFISSCSIYS